MASVLLSVIIPTFGRGIPLSAAISSALNASPDGSVEIIVIPNGPNEDWRAIKHNYQNDSRIKWFPIQEANVSAARNRGLTIATGQYIRFLDDDDYLFEDASKRQLKAALLSDADVCSGSVAIVNEAGEQVGLKEQPLVTDLSIAACGPRRMVQVGAHLIKRAVAQSVRWNESRALAEDVEWLIQIATLAERKWLRFEEPVAAWVQHRNFRLSRGHDPGARTLRYIAEVILEAAERLEMEGRLTVSRRVAIADGLWAVLQKGLRYDFGYWTAVARMADICAPGRRPPSRIHQLAALRRLPPLWIETALIPLRLAYAPVRATLDQLGINRT